MCMYCMYVHVFVSMHFLQIASHIFLVENMFKVLPPPSHYKSFLQVGQCMYVSQEQLKQVMPDFV